MSKRFIGETATEGKWERSRWRPGELSDHNAGLTYLRKRQKENVWVKCLGLPCSLRKVPSGCQGILEPMLSIRGALHLAEMELHLCPHCVQPLAGRVQRKPVEITAKGVHGACGPTVS